MPKVKSTPSTSATSRQAGGPSSSTTTQYSGFSPVPVRITLSNEPTPNSTKGKSPQVHYLWIREHKSRPSKAGEPSGTSTTTIGNGVNPILIKPTLMKTGNGEETPENMHVLAQGRTLFIANLAVDMDTESIRTIFKEYGPVEDIEIRVSKVGKQGVEAWMGSDDEQDDDEDDEDEDDESVTEMAEQDEEDDPSAGPSETPRPARPSTDSLKKRRRKNKSGPSAPPIVPLSSLLPRAQPLLLPSSSAYLTYLSPLSLRRALDHAPSRKAVEISHDPSSTGLAYYTRSHRSMRPDLGLIKDHADSALALYDHHLEAQRRKTTQGAIVDEDGFTLVVRGGKFGRTAGKGSAGVGVASRRFVLDSKKAGIMGEVDAREGLDRGKKRKGGVELDGFYRFQRNERKRQDLADLRRAFADDQAKVADLKAQKRFRPY